MHKFVYKLVLYSLFMSNLNKAIGYTLENVFSKNFPGFDNHADDGEGVPDFYNPKFGFWVECKNGNILWGQRLKSDQEESFKRVSGPIVYFLGLHDYHAATQRLAGKSLNQMKQTLGRWMEIKETYLITDSVINSVLRQESRLNKKGTISYCMLKKSLITHILQDRSFTRFNQRVNSAHEYLEYSPQDFTLKEFSPFFGNMHLAGIFLEKKQDSPVEAYLRENFPQLTF